MDRELVIEELKKTVPMIKEISSAGLSLSEKLKFSKVVREFEISKPLAQILKKQDEFLKYKNLHFNNGGGSMQFSSEQAALFLCRQAEKRGPEAAVDSLIDIFAITKADLLCVMALRGVCCEKEIQLSKTIKMVPMALLPPSWRKDSIEKSNTDFGNNLGAFSALNLDPFSLQRFERAFLISSIKLRPVIFDCKSNEKKDLSGLEVHKAFSSLDKVRLCLTAIGNCSPLVEYNWNQYTDEVLEDAANLSGGVSYHQIEIVPFRLRKSETIQQRDATAIIKSFFKLDKKLQSKLITALDRLNQAMRRFNVGDMAVELSIALESLLLGEEKGDNLFKVALRSGIAFSPNMDERIECREVIKKMYVFRSNLIHKGDHGNSKPQNKDVIEKAIRFTAIIIKNLIINEQEPNWSILEISGKSIEEAGR